MKFGLFSKVCIIMYHLHGWLLSSLLNNIKQRPTISVQSSDKKIQCTVYCVSSYYSAYHVSFYHSIYCVSHIILPFSILCMIIMYHLTIQCFVYRVSSYHSVYCVLHNILLFTVLFISHQLTIHFTVYYVSSSNSVYRVSSYLVDNFLGGLILMFQVSDLPLQFVLFLFGILLCLLELVFK